MYVNDMLAADWSVIFNNRGQEMLNTKNNANEIYEKWYVYAYGLTDAALATKMGITEAQVVDYKYAASMFKDMVDVFRTVAVAARDRESDIIKFTDV